MKNLLPILFFVTYGISTSFPFAAIAAGASDKTGGSIVLAQAHAPAVKRINMREALASLSNKPEAAAENKSGDVDTVGQDIDSEADALLTTSLDDAGAGGIRKRNLEFSGRTGPKLRIGVRQKKVRFALNFKLVDDVVFAPAYRLAIAGGDFQNPNGYTAHSVFFGMRFRFESGSQ